MSYTQKHEELIMIKILLTEEGKKKFGKIRRRTSDYRSERALSVIINSEDGLSLQLHRLFYAVRDQQTR